MKLGHPLLFFSAVLGFSLGLVAPQAAPQVASKAGVKFICRNITYLFLWPQCLSPGSVVNLAEFLLRAIGLLMLLALWFFQLRGTTSPVQSVLMGCHIPWPSMAGNL